MLPGHTRMIKSNTNRFISTNYFRILIYLEAYDDWFLAFRDMKNATNQPITSTPPKKFTKNIISLFSLFRNREIPKGRKYIVQQKIIPNMILIVEPMNTSKNLFSNYRTFKQSLHLFRTRAHDQGHDHGGIRGHY